SAACRWGATLWTLVLGRSPELPSAVPQESADTVSAAYVAVSAGYVAVSANYVAVSADHAGVFADRGARPVPPVECRTRCRTVLPLSLRTRLPGLRTRLGRLRTRLPNASVYVTS